MDTAIHHDHHSHDSADGARARGGSFGLAWALVAVALVVSVVGYFLNWYQRFAYFDEAIHAFSFFSITLLTGLYLYGDALTGYARHKVLLVFTLLCVGLAMGVVWEWAEWGYDRLLADQSNAIKGKADTLADLLVDGAGALAAGIVMLALLRRERD